MRSGDIPVCFAAFNQAMPKSRIIDLTHPLTPLTPIYPADPPFRCTPYSTHDRDGYSVHHLSFGTHTGTHLDAPFHFDKDGEKVEEISLEKLVGRAWVLDLSADVDGADGLRERERIEWETLASQLPPQLIANDTKNLNLNPILLIHTSWSKYYTTNTEKYFSHPYLSPSIASHLLSLGITVVGVDTFSPDETPRLLDGWTKGNDGFGFHEAFLRKGGVIVENLVNIQRLLESSREDNGKWMVSLAPLKLQGMDGSPVRAFAFLVPIEM